MKNVNPQNKSCALCTRFIPNTWCTKCDFEISPEAKKLMESINKREEEKGGGENDEWRIY